MSGLATDYLDEAARRFPEKAAIIDEQRQVSYSELRQEALAVGAALAAAGIRGAVALWLGRTAAHIAAGQGAAYCGCAYVPLDISMPLRRLLKLYRVLRPAAVITDKAQEQEAGAFLANLGESAPRLFIYEEMVAEGKGARPPLSERMAERSEDDPLCIIFTSGSTGTPKGVVSSHRMLRSFPDWEGPHFGLDESQVRAGQAPLYMAMGAYCDTYSVLASAGTLLLLDPRRFMFPRELLARLRELGANTLFWVPSLYRAVADYGALAQGALPTLRLAAFCGEPMPVQTLRAWQENFPGVRFANLYGSTEMNITGYYEAEPGFAGESLPLGRACQGREIMLWDSSGSLVPPGTAGEMVVRGPVALGYLAESRAGGDLAIVPSAGGQAVFLPDPEAGRSQPAGARLYRTGDLARQDEEGQLIYVSRRDAQVKHMGYRIELGEIETAAAQVPGLSVSACLHDGAHDELVLFYQADPALTARELMGCLSEALPRYMWPTRLEKCSELPLTASGKVDRRALQVRLRK